VVEAPDLAAAATVAADPIAALALDDDELKAEPDPTPFPERWRYGLPEEAFAHALSVGWLSFKTETEWARFRSEAITQRKLSADWIAAWREHCRAVAAAQEAV
jgi:hypothetical protein